jgi:hypothetical protein
MQTHFMITKQNYTVTEIEPTAEPIGMLRAEALGLRILSVADARFASRLPLCFLQGLVTSLRLERKLRNNELC